MFGKASKKTLLAPILPLKDARAALEFERDDLEANGQHADAAALDTVANSCSKAIHNLLEIKYRLDVLDAEEAKKETEQAPTTMPTMLPSKPQETPDGED